MIRLKLAENKSLEKVIYDALKQGIFSGHFQPGERLIESTLAAQLNVSRTPMREAIKRLEIEKLVEIFPNKGATVLKVSPDDIKEMYETVGILEGYVCGLSVSKIESQHIERLKGFHKQLQDEELQQDYKNWLRINSKFHNVYQSICQKPNIVELIYNRQGPLARYWYISCTLPGLIKRGISDHGKIITAFETGDRALARSTAEDHFIITGHFLREHFQKISVL